MLFVRVSVCVLKDYYNDNKDGRKPSCILCFAYGNQHTKLLTEKQNNTCELMSSTEMGQACRCVLQPKNRYKKTGV